MSSRTAPRYLNRFEGVGHWATGHVPTHSSRTQLDSGDSETLV